MKLNDDIPDAAKLRINQPTVNPAERTRGSELVWREASQWRSVESRYHALQDKLASTEELLSTARLQCVSQLEEQRSMAAGLQRLMQAINGYDYHVVVKDGRPVSTTHGKICVQITGFTPEEYLADPYLWYHMIHEEDRPTVLAYFNALLMKEHAGYLEHRINHRSGVLRWVRNYTAAWYDATGMLSGYDGIIIDITELKQMEDQVRQAQKMDVVGAMFSGIVHDFNNLITVMAGHAYILSRHFDASDPEVHSVKCLMDICEKAKLLTGRMLSFSRKGSYHVKAIRINEVIRGLHVLMRPLLHENIVMEMRLSSDDPSVFVDRGQFEQVLMNLAVNAVDAMSYGGQLILTTAMVYRAECGNDIPQTGAAEHLVMISVADTGSGIPPDVRQHMYEPFFTTKEPGKGSGLGLSIVDSIVKQHGGFIVCSSEPGLGTEFRLYLPAAGGEQELDRSGRTHVAPSGTEHILVVDDDSDVLSVVADTLERLGFKVTRASGGAEALSVFKERAEDIQCLVLDYALPGMNGIQVYNEITKIRPQVPVVFTSGYPIEASPLNSISFAHSMVLYKPFLPSEIGQAVRMTMS